MNLKQMFPVSPAARLMSAALVIALLGGAMSLAQAQPMGRGHGASHGGMMGGPMVERLLDGVNASPEQRSRIRDIMKAAGEDMRKQREANRGLHDQAMSVFTQPTVDARATEALRQQMMQQHEQSSRRMTQALLDASAVLTPEQRAQLAERLKQRRDMAQRHHSELRALEQPSR